MLSAEIDKIGGQTRTRIRRREPENEMAYILPYPFEMPEEDHKKVIKRVGGFRIAQVIIHNKHLVGKGFWDYVSSFVSKTAIPFLLEQAIGLFTDDKEQVKEITNLILPFIEILGKDAIDFIIKNASKGLDWIINKLQIKAKTANKLENKLMETINKKTKKGKGKRGGYIKLDDFIMKHHKRLGRGFNESLMNGLLWTTKKIIAPIAQTVLPPVINTAVAKTFDTIPQYLAERLPGNYEYEDPSKKSARKQAEEIARERFRRYYEATHQKPREAHEEKAKLGTTRTAGKIFDKSKSFWENHLEPLAEPITEIAKAAFADYAQGALWGRPSVIQGAIDDYRRRNNQPPRPPPRPPNTIEMTRMTKPREMTDIAGVKKLSGTMGQLQLRPPLEEEFKMEKRPEEKSTLITMSQKPTAKAPKTEAEKEAIKQRVRANAQEQLQNISIKPQLKLALAEAHMTAQPAIKEPIQSKPILKPSAYSRPGLTIGYRASMPNKGKVQEYLSPEDKAKFERFYSPEERKILLSPAVRRPEPEQKDYFEDIFSSIPLPPRLTVAEHRAMFNKPLKRPSIEEIGVFMETPPQERRRLSQEGPEKTVFYPSTPKLKPKSIVKSSQSFLAPREYPELLISSTPLFSTTPIASRQPSRQPTPARSRSSSFIHDMPEQKQDLSFVRAYPEQQHERAIPTRQLSARDLQLQQAILDAEKAIEKYDTKRSITGLSKRKGSGACCYSCKMKRGKCRNGRGWWDDHKGKILGALSTAATLGSMAYIGNELYGSKGNSSSPAIVPDVGEGDYNPSRYSHLDY